MRTGAAPALEPPAARDAVPVDLQLEQFLRGACAHHQPRGGPDRDHAEGLRERECHVLMVAAAQGGDIGGSTDPLRAIARRSAAEQKATMCGKWSVRSRDDEHRSVRVNRDLVRGIALDKLTQPVDPA